MAQSYCINYKMHQHDEEHLICEPARNKAEAYDRAVYEAIPKKEGSMPYSAWVTSVTYRNGKCIRFNTHEGKPY